MINRQFGNSVSKLFFGKERVGIAFLTNLVLKFRRFLQIHSVPVKDLF